MNALRGCTVAVFVALVGLSPTHSAARQAAAHESAWESMIGAWHLVALDNIETNGKRTHITDCKGTLLYTRDGHMSVEIMYPKSESSLSNEYVRNGYEASFGSFDVNERTHTVTHHLEGSITRALVGKNLPRVFRFSNGHLIISSPRPDEHWSVTWERY